MKVFFLALTSVFVAAQAFPRTGEESATLQKLEERKNIQFGTPEYDEVVNEFNITIIKAQGNVYGLRVEGHELLNTSENGTKIHTKYDDILNPYLSELMSSILEVFHSLPSASSFEEVVTTSKAVWDTAIYNRGKINYVIQDLIRAEAPELLMDFNIWILRKWNIQFENEVGAFYEVLKKYLS